jgi:hypothetical protein
MFLAKKVFDDTKAPYSYRSRKDLLTPSEKERLEKRKKTLENVFNLPDQSSFEKYLNALPINKDKGINMINDTRVYDIDKMDELVNSYKQYESSREKEI